jgi:hypothetical protein
MAQRAICSIRNSSSSRTWAGASNVDIDPCEVGELTQLLRDIAQIQSSLTRCGIECVDFGIDAVAEVALAQFAPYGLGRIELERLRRQR